MEQELPPYINNPANVFVLRQAEISNIYQNIFIDLQSEEETYLTKNYLNNLIQEKLDNCLLCRRLIAYPQKYQIILTLSDLFIYPIIQIYFHFTLHIKWINSKELYLENINGTKYCNGCHLIIKLFSTHITSAKILIQLKRHILIRNNETKFYCSRAYQLFCKTLHKKIL